MRNTLAVLILVLAGGAMTAQEMRQGPPVPCPHPFTIASYGASGPPTPDPGDLGKYYPATVGSQWNQTAIDKTFGHTFHFTPPSRECCEFTSGILTIKVKALQTGGPKSSTSANDEFSLVSNGVPVPGQSQQPWLTSGVTAGTIKTLTFTVPASALTAGRISILGEDDSAFLSADLTLNGCCIHKPK